MFSLTVAWWELVLRGASVYVVLLAMMRLSGKRTVGQFTPFDLLVVMLLSEAVSNGLTGGDESLVGALVLALTLMGLNVALAWVTSRSARLHTFIEGEPQLIGRDGRILHEALRRCRVPIADVQQALREADCEEKDIKCAFLEIDGKISILKN